MTAHDKTVLLNTLTRFIEESISPQERRDITCEMCRRLTGFNIEKYLNNTHNNRKLKIKRGNSVENDNYTGVCGEITMDTDCNTIRVHDGTTPGGTIMARADIVPDMSGTDYVVEWQVPTLENNNAWYRKYKSGWVEQGGIFDTPGKGYQTIQLPVEMADTVFSAHVTRAAGTSTSAIDCWIQSPGASLSTTTLVYYVTAQTGLTWRVCGFAKQ